MSEKENENTILTIDVAKVVKKPSAVKITNEKRKLFLETYLRTGNFTKAALAAGHTRASFYFLLKTDEKFKKAFKAVEDAILDQAEECLLTVALQPSREGFQDRKLLLQAKRNEIYGNKMQVNSQHHVKVDISIPELNRILASQSVSKPKTQATEIPEDIDYVEVREDEK